MELHYGEPQTAIAITFALIAVGIAALMTLIALQTRRDVPFDRVRAVGYAIRRWWLLFLAVLLVAVVGTTLLDLPYSSQARHVTVVRVIGGQFYWSASPAKVPAGTHVRFDVTSADVNHGLGLYAPDGKLLGSVQAMPGFHNKLDLTLKEPGEYLISCLEFCGLNHHLMSRPFKVVRR